MSCAFQLSNIIELPEQTQCRECSEKIPVTNIREQTVSEAKHIHKKYTEESLTVRRVILRLGSNGHNRQWIPVVTQTVRMDRGFV